MKLLALALESVEHHILKLQKDLNNAEAVSAKINEIIFCDDFNKVSSDATLKKITTVLNERGYAVGKDEALIRLREIIIESKKDNR